MIVCLYNESTLAVAVEVEVEPVEELEPEPDEGINLLKKLFNWSVALVIKNGGGSREKNLLY